LTIAIDVKLTELGRILSLKVKTMSEFTGIFLTEQVPLLQPKEQTVKDNSAVFAALFPEDEPPPPQDARRKAARTGEVRRIFDMAQSDPRVLRVAKNRCDPDD
jgi:hypothetical protein